MAIGDDALAAGMSILSGSELANTLDTEVNRTRDYIAQRTSAVTTIAKGGTGATTAAAARTNLDVPSNATLTSGLAGKAATTHTHDTLVNGGNQFGYRGSSVWGTTGALDIDGRVDVGGHIYVPNAVPTSGIGTVAYIDNSDGRISKGASSERYKDKITPLEAVALGDIFPDLFEFVMRADPDQSPRVGWIAERLHENPATRRFVIYATETVEESAKEGTMERRVLITRLKLDDDGNPMPDSIDFISLLIAQVSQLHARLQVLEGGGQT